MWKTLLAGTTALVVASGTLAVAQTAPRTETPGAQQTTQPNAQDANQAANAALDARLARIKARLRLTSEQETHWPAVDAAIRDVVKERATRINERRAARETAGAPRPDLIERMRLRADAMTTRAAEIKKLADASDPLYKSLTDRQKRQLVAMVRNAGAFASQGWRGEGRRGEEGRFHRWQRFSHHNGRGHQGYPGYGYPDRYVR
jgi:zinc resistance-associated protein